MKKKFTGMLSLSLAAMMLGISTPSHATSISLGEAGGYAAIELGGSSTATVFMGNDTTRIYGDLGIGPNSTYYLQKGTVTGKTYIGLSATGTTGFKGTIDTSRNLLNAFADATAASSAFQSLGGTLLTIKNGQTINGNGGDNIYSLINPGTFNNMTFTINGSANDYFIFNVTGDFDFASSTILLSGGATADHVLWNVIGTDPGDPIVLSVSGAFVGTILAPYRAIRVDHLSVYGQLIAGNDSVFSGLTSSSSDLSIHSDADLYFISFSPVSPHPVPEPASLPLIVSGIACIAVYKFGSARLKRQNPSTHRPILLSAK